MTLNLLRGSRLDPRISAWEQMHGKYNFDAHPIAPLGMRIVMHEKPHQRGSWSPHGVDGFISVQHSNTIVVITVGSLKRNVNERLTRSLGIRKMS